MNDSNVTSTFRTMCGAVNPNESDHVLCAYKPRHITKHSWEDDRVIGYADAQEGPGYPITGGSITFAGISIEAKFTASIPSSSRDAAYKFLKDCGLEPTADAVDQLNEVFLPCLKIICERGWDPLGGTWRKSGVLGILTDVRKKFERLWERGWKNGQRHDDSALDMINYLGFYMRSQDNRWGQWGEPAYFHNAENDD